MRNELHSYLRSLSSIHFGKSLWFAWIPCNEQGRRTRSGFRSGQRTTTTTFSTFFFSTTCFSRLTALQQGFNSYNEHRATTSYNESQGPLTSQRDPTFFVSTVQSPAFPHARRSTTRVSATCMIHDLCLDSVNVFQYRISYEVEVLISGKRIPRISRIYSCACYSDRPPKTIIRLNMLALKTTTLLRIGSCL